MEEGGGWRTRLGPSLLVSRREGHDGVRQFLERLGCLVEVEGRRATVHSHILDRVIDGHRLVLDQLHTMMEQEFCPSCPESSTNQARITITFDSLFDEKSGKQLGVVNDLVERLAADRREGAEEIFQHPVIQCLVLHKWRAYKVFFTLRSRLFMAFVMTFSSHVRVQVGGDSLSSPDSLLLVAWLLFLWLFLTCLASSLASLYSLGCSRQPYSPLASQEKEEPVNRLKEERARLTSSLAESAVTTLALLLAFTSLTLGLLPTTSLLTSSTSSVCLVVLEVILVVLVSIFVLRECLHLVVLLHRLLSQSSPSLAASLADSLTSPDTWLVLLSLLGAAVEVALVHLHQDDLGPLVSVVFQGVVATGICSAWLHMIFLLGQPSHTFLGDFIVMFYNTFKVRLWSYVKIVCLFLVGFTLTFWSLQMGQHRDRASQAGGFADFWLGLARTGAMAIGELDIEQFSANFSLTDAEAGPAVISRTFALLLLSAFTLSGTVVLVSLLIASIVRDYKEMKAEVDLQNVQFMAQYIVRLEASLALLSWLLPLCVTNIVSYFFL